MTEWLYYIVINLVKVNKMIFYCEGFFENIYVVVISIVHKNQKNVNWKVDILDTKYWNLGTKDIQIDIR